MKTYVQQIMLGSVTSNEAQARETLQKIKAAGYDGLELNRFMIHPSSLMVRMMTRAAGMPTGNGGKLDWKALLRESGCSYAQGYLFAKPMPAREYFVFADSRA